MNSFRSLLLFFLLLTPLFLMAMSEEEAKKRIYNHLLIRDPLTAVKEGRKALEEFPESHHLRFALLDALCQCGEETEALELWHSCSLEEKNDRRILEMLAWGVLSKKENSSLLNMQLYTLLGAAFTRDARVIPLLLQHMQGSNALLRSLAVKLSCQFGDAPLKNCIARLLKEEKVWYVRLEVIQAIGALRMMHLKNTLKEIIAHPKTLAEEKGVAIHALVMMYDTLEREEVIQLVKSNRAGLRQLCCEAIAYLNAYEHLDLLLSLLNDESPDVRLSVLSTLALLRVREVDKQPIAELIEKKGADEVPEVAITAAYVLLLLDHPLGQEWMRGWLSSAQPKYRRMASAALAASGIYGVKLSLFALEKSEDSYVKANCALALLGQRVHLDAACDALYALLTKEKDTLWMWDDAGNPLFRSLAPSHVKHIQQIPHYPAVVDQLVRLDLLSCLSIVRYFKAQKAVKEFLQNREWGVTGAAAATLLQEGDEEGLEAVRALLDDPDEKIRFQAALIMTLVGHDLTAAKVLKEAYPHVDREMKVHILEAIAHVHDKEAIPFLLSVLSEPFQLLRTVAASALIQCLSQ